MPDTALSVPAMYSAFYTPRISLGRLKTVICACPSGPRVVLVGGATRAVPGVRWGGYTGWVPGRGTTQPVYPYIGIARAQPVVYPGSTVSPGTPRPLLGLSAHLAPAPVPRPIWARFQDKYPKVSHNPGVSSKKRHEACHAPYLKKRPISHDLEFPRFPYGVAFSRKE